MSRFSHFEGTIKFSNPQKYKQAIDLGHQRGKFSDFEPDNNNLTLTFPDIISTNDGTKGLYNFIEELGQIGYKGRLVGICTDGISEGYVIENGSLVYETDLIEWAVNNMDEHKGKSVEEINKMEESEDDEVLDEFYIMLNKISTTFIERNS